MEFLLCKGPEFGIPFILGAYERESNNKCVK